MAKQDAVSSLKESIRLLEIRQAEEGKQLKEQFKITYESLKPANLLKNSIKELTSSVELKNSLFETIVTIVSSYVTQKFMVSSKSNPFNKILGVLMQFGVTHLISNNAETIRTFLSNMIEKFTHPEEEKVHETEH